MKNFSDLDQVDSEGNVLSFEDTLRPEDDFFSDNSISTPSEDGEKLLLRLGLKQLTEIQRKVIQGTYFDGKSQSALAKQLKISQPAVNKHLDLALNKLRKICLGRGSDRH